MKNLQQAQEEIFRQLQLLIPEQVTAYDSFESRVDGSPCLRLEVLERHPFTQFLRLTYQFDNDDAHRLVPDAHIRLYLDAQIAEVTAFNSEQGFTRTAHPWYPQRPLMQRLWRENVALDKWLGYLISQGHSFETMQPVEEGIPEVCETDLAVSIV